MEPIPGVTQLTLDMTDADSPDRIREALGGKQADLVLSDMHAPAMGHKSTDHLRIMSLVEAALDLAEEILAPGGAFLCKVLQGGADKELVARLNRSFAKVRHVKPKASRADSAEMYVLATGFPRRCPRHETFTQLCSLLVLRGPSRAANLPPNSS